ncbi:TPA: pyruvate ferredoxin oxidoreductase [Candidatus Bathyarchaeota archaeon]|nr:pyruvate ferredoxin oxidoreductase [Candidatus Bathyarchaeota archaeon]
MVEVRIHCRGGQGGVTAARIIGLAAVKEGKHALAFPSFTVERRGAPIMAFIRISENEIFDRSFIYNPDYVLIFDPGLLTHPSVKMGVREDTFFLVNAKSLKEATALEAKRLATVDASSIALEVLGVPIVNTAMCGAFAAASRLIGMETLTEAIKEFLPVKVANKNIEAALKAYREVKTYGKNK